MSYICYLPSGPHTIPHYVTNNLYFLIPSNDLIPFTSCLVHVYSENPCNSANNSGPVVNVYARTSDIVPDPVQSLSAVAVSDHSLFVTWEPPLNYMRPGLSYSVNIAERTSTFAGHVSTVLDQTYFFMNMNLTPSTQYKIDVTAISSVGMSMDTTVNRMTKPSLPHPPDNVQFLIQNNRVTLEWNAQSDATNYTVFWKCNEMDGNITTINTSVLISTSINLGSSYTWCTARVQSANVIGLSDLSAAVSTVIPQSVPPPPICFLADNRGSSVTVSFTISAPFALDELSVNWQLIDTTSTTRVSTDTHGFENNSLTILVERNTAYTFSLRLCNLQGCGDYCSSIAFTTNTVSFLTSMYFRIRLLRPVHNTTQCVASPCIDACRITTQH